MPEKTDAEVPTYRIKTQSGFPVSLETKNDTLTTEHTVSPVEVGRVAIAAALEDQQFLNPMLDKLFSRQVDCGEISRIDISRVQEGKFEYIYLGKVVLKNGNSRPVIFATSKGLFTPEKAARLLNDQYPEVKGSKLRPLYAAYLQQLMEKQVWIDYQALSYLKRIFRERSLPCEISEPYAFTTKYVKAEKVKDLQPVSILAMELLAAPEGCLGGEINPGQYLPEYLPGEGFTWYWRANSFEGPDDVWNDKCLSSDIYARNERMRWMGEKTAELLAYIYFASGRLPYWFSPEAGDILFLGEKPKIDSETNFHLGLITARGGLHPLEKEDFVPGVGQIHEFELPKPGSLSARNFNMVSDPDLGLLYSVLGRIMIKPNLFDYLKNFGKSKSDSLKKTSISLFPRKEWLAKGIITAYEKFYGRSFEPSELVLSSLSRIPFFQDRSLRLEDIIGQGKISQKGSPEKILEVYCKLNKAAELIGAGLKDAGEYQLGASSTLLDKKKTDETISQSTVILKEIPFREEILSFIFGNPIEIQTVIEREQRLTVRTYDVDPGLVGGKRNVKVQMITDEKSEKIYLEFFQPKR